MTLIFLFSLVLMVLGLKQASDDSAFLHDSDSILILILLHVYEAFLNRSSFCLLLSALLVVLHEKGLHISD